MVVWRVSLATLGVLAIQVGECSILSVLVLRFTERSFVYNLVWACRVLEGGASSSDGRVYRILFVVVEATKSLGLRMDSRCSNSN